MSYQIKPLGTTAEPGWQHRLARGDSFGPWQDFDAGFEGFGTDPQTGTDITTGVTYWLYARNLALPPEEEGSAQQALATAIIVTPEGRVESLTPGAVLCEAPDGNTDTLDGLPVILTNAEYPQVLRIGTTANGSRFIEATDLSIPSLQQTMEVDPRTSVSFDLYGNAAYEHTREAGEDFPYDAGFKFFKRLVAGGPRQLQGIIGQLSNGKIGIGSADKGALWLNPATGVWELEGPTFLSDADASFKSLHLNTLAIAGPNSLILLATPNEEKGGHDIKSLTLDELGDLAAPTWKEKFRDIPTTDEEIEILEVCDILEEEEEPPLPANSSLIKNLKLTINNALGWVNPIPLPDFTGMESRGQGNWPVYINLGAEGLGSNPVYPLGNRRYGGIQLKPWGNSGDGCAFSTQGMLANNATERIALVGSLDYTQPITDSNGLRGVFGFTNGVAANGGPEDNTYAVIGIDRSLTNTPCLVALLSNNNSGFRQILLDNIVVNQGYEVWVVMNLDTSFTFGVGQAALYTSPIAGNAAYVPVSSYPLSIGGWAERFNGFDTGINFSPIQAYSL